MRRNHRILAVLILIAVPVVWVSAQQFPRQNQSDRQDRRFDSGRRFDRRSFGSERSSTSAPSGPITFPAQPLPREFALLNQRSIFSKDHLTTSGVRPRPIFNGPQSTLVFRGAMKEGDTFKANIEDTSSSAKKPTWVEVGGLLTENGAQIKEITLDYIVINNGGTMRKIEVGDRLDSGTRVSAPSAAPTSLVTGPATRPSPTAAASTAGTASEDAILDMMRARRQQELGQ